MPHPETPIEKKDDENTEEPQDSTETPTDTVP